MDSIIDINLDSLKTCHPGIFQLMKGYNDDGSIEVVRSRDNNPVPLVNIEGRKIYLHSRFDPVKESERFIGGIDTEKHDLFIVFGLAFAYHVEDLLKKAGGGSIVLVIERSPAIFHKLLMERDISHLFNDKRLLVLLDPVEDSIADALKGRPSRSVSFITHRGSHQVSPDYYYNMLEKARSYISTKDVNIATLAKFEKIWASNVARNIGNFINNPGANIFYGSLQDIPAIVVSAGPSLTKSLDFISGNTGRCVVIAVDTAYRILLRNGITPHFCVAVDPQVINARYFEGVSRGKTILVTEPTVHPSVYRLFHGRIAVAGVAFDIMKWIERITGEKGEVTHGGSVSTNAYDFARRMGASPIYMTGQDLAFTWGLAHAAGSYLEEQVFIGRDRLRNELMHNRFQLTALPKIFVKGIRSETVHTNHKMMIFHSWFRDRNDRNIINITHDGALISGISHMRIEDLVIEDRGIDLWGVIDGIYDRGVSELNARNGIMEKLRGKIGVMLDEVSQLIPLLERAGGFSDTLHDMIRTGKKDGNKIDYILMKLAETDRIIETKKNIKDMISLTIQRVIHTINEGYDMDEGDSGLENDVLVAKKSLYLYRGLMEGALFNRKILAKMMKMIV